MFVGAALLLPTYYTFRLTSLLYVLLAIHACILMIGGHFTYAEVPLFDWIRDTLHLARNHYDRVGHFAQGFVPFILTFYSDSRDFDPPVAAAPGQVAQLFIDCRMFGF